MSDKHLIKEIKDHNPEVILVGTGLPKDTLMLMIDSIQKHHSQIVIVGAPDISESTVNLEGILFVDDLELLNEVRMEKIIERTEDPLSELLKFHETFCLKNKFSGDDIDHIHDKHSYLNLQKTNKKDIYKRKIGKSRNR